MYKYNSRGDAALKIYRWLFLHAPHQRLVLKCTQTSFLSLFNTASAREFDLCIPAAKALGTNKPNLRFVLPCIGKL